MKPFAILLFVPLLVAAADPPHTRRSPGFAGSTPVGLDAYGAFAKFDCGQINRDPQRSHVRVPLAIDCSIAIPSPDGHLTARSGPAPNSYSLVLRVTGGLVVTDLLQPITFLWSPKSDGFLLNDGEGSGQTSKLRYFEHRRGGWRESRRLHKAAEKLFLRRQRCRAGGYVNVSGMDWTLRGEIRAIVQEGVHSKGCLEPEDGDLELEVVGNPRTGKIRSVRAKIFR